MSKFNFTNVFSVVILLLTSSAPLHAQKKPIQIAVFAPIQLFDDSNHIEGIRLSLLYGRNVSVKGLDVGFISHSTSGKSVGVQFGFIGLNESDFTGWQDTFVNITKGSFEGLQAGVLNYAKRMNGVQFGLVNYAGTMKGIQIGLLNIIKSGGTFPVFPIVNWSF